MRNKNPGYNLNWKSVWREMRGQRMRPVKIKFDPAFKEKFAKNYSERAESNDYEYGRKAIKALSEILEENFKVLEIGPGPGTLTIPLAKMVKRIVVVEASKLAVGHLLKNLAKSGVNNVEVINENWEKINLKDNFDLVICSHFLWQMKDIETLLKKMEIASNRYCAVIQPAGRESIIKEAWKKMTGEDYKGQFEPDADHFVYLILRQWGKLVNVRVMEYNIERNLGQEIRYIASFVGKCKKIDRDAEKFIRKFLIGESENGIFKARHSAVVMWWRPDGRYTT